jgi:L-lysine 6-transaminase
MIIEPVQAEGGDKHFRDQWFTELRQLAEENDFMLIYDEVQTGMGLTGKMWCWEHFGSSARPDIVAFGKKFQVCGILVGDKIDQAKYNVFSDEMDETMGVAPGVARLNSTWGGNLADMVRGTYYLRIVEEEKLLDNATEMGEYLLKNIQDMEQEFPEVSNARGRGLMCAFDMPDHASRDLLFNTLIGRGLLILRCGEKTMRFRPHLDVTKEDIDKCMATIKETIHELRMDHEI